MREGKNYGRMKEEIKVTKTLNEQLDIGGKRSK